MIVGSVPFTQYLRPHGFPTMVTIAMDELTVRLAHELIRSSHVFDIEVLRTGEVSMTCELAIGMDRTVVSQVICSNGPAVVPSVERLVHTAHREWRLKRGVSDG